MRWLVLLALGAGCVSSDSVKCGDRTCPSDSSCDNVHSLCVSHDQASACSQLVDGDFCHAMDIDVPGVCDQGFCVPGCGDGVTQDPNAVGVVEECDDGNFQSHDGCSSTCTAETPVWLERVEQWRGRYSHATAYMANLDKLVMLGGVDQIQGFPDDQWERDSAGKWRRIANSGVGQRSSPAMAFDTSRNVIVLFGGYLPNKQPLGDTWEYDGTTWTKKSITGGPTPRGGATMVWDSTRNKIVMFGGQTAIANTNSAEVWEYSNGAWTLVPTTGAIPGRHLQSMAYDSARQRIVVFGGIADTTVAVDTWEYAPATSTWTQNVSATHPSRRYSAAMSFQAAPRNKVVLFGGGTTQGGGVQVTFADQWEYDAAGWVEVTTPVRPPGRFGATLTAVAGNELALVSGATGTDIIPLTDAWQYSTTAAWSDVSPEFPPRREGSMAYDSKHDVLTMFSGNTTSGADTWTFDGTSWSDVTPTTTSPSARLLNAVAYDAKRERVVMFGGSSGVTFLDDTWEWDGEAKTWAPYSGTTKPPARNFVHLTYDDNAGVTVLFGGSNAAALTDTWEYDGTMWTDRTAGAGTAPKPGNFTMAYDPDHKRVVGFDGADKTFSYVNHHWQELTVEGDPPLSTPISILLPSIAHDPQRHVMTLYDANTSRVWELNDQTWTRVRVIGTVPPPRYLPAFAEHVKSRRLILFGGGAAGGAIGDTWYFGYRSETPDELCGDGMDNDDDKHVDGADPDCLVIQ